MGTLARSPYYLRRHRRQNNKFEMPMQGLTLASLKKHPALIPLYAACGFGVMLTVLYTGRLALKNPDVAWANKSNAHPQMTYDNKQYKFFSPVRDYSTYRCERPNFEDDE